MSQKNVEILRRFHEAGRRSFEAYWKNPRSGVAALENGDLDPETEEVLAFLHPEVELNPRAAALSGGTGRGHLGWLTLWDELLAASEDFRITLSELEDLGGGEVLAVSEQAVTWRGSGMEMNATVFYLFTLREGLIVRVDAYRDRREALEAVGIEGQMISNANFEIIREFIADRNRAKAFDHTRFHPDVEWHALSESVSAGVYRGHEAVRGYFAEVEQEWETRHFEIDELIDAGENKVVAVVRNKARGKRSGAEVELTLAYLCAFRDGLVASVHSYETRAEALEAAGLSEHDPHA